MFEQYISAPRSENCLYECFIFVVYNIYSNEKSLIMSAQGDFFARFRTKLRIIQCFQVKKSFVESVLFFSGSRKQNSSLIACADSRSLSFEIMSSLTLSC